MNTQHHTAPSWRRWLVLACPPLVAIVCALTLTLPALAAKVFNISYPISGTATNPCNGEVITFSGNEHDTLAITLDGNGGVHFVFHGNMQDVTGVGDLGNTYLIPAAATDSNTGRVGYEETFAEAFHVLAQGPAPSFFFHEVYHITINPDGTVASFHHTISTSCQG